MKKINIILSVLFSIIFCFCKPVSVEETNEEHAALPFEFAETTIDDLQARFTAGTLSVESLAQAYIDRINAIDKRGPTLNAVIQINPDAIEIARQLDAELKAGNKRGPLHGIPILLKDNIDTHDKMSTTAGSRALAGSIAPQDSWVAKSLREAGALIIGKANLSEWANFRGDLSSSGWSGVGGQVKNPYMLDRNPCGSSSGSGAAVSANLCMVAIGTETNGSIVCPSNANGVVGIKPTVGLISRSGIIPISFTQDTPGPMARTVKDAAICLGAMTGIDSTDTKTLGIPEAPVSDYTPYLDANALKGKRLGWYKAAAGRHYKVDALMEKAIEDLKKAGAEIIEIEQIAETPVNRYSFQVLLYEFKDGLNKYFATLGPEAKVKSLEDLIAFNEKDSVELKYFDQNLLIMAQEKAGLDSEEYLNALSTMKEVMQESGIDKIMAEQNLDAFIAPTGGPAWKTDLTNGDHFSLGSSSPAAIAGYPNISVPMGFIEGLPVGISFFGKAWSESQLLGIAYAYEQATRHRKAPAFKTSQNY